MTYEPDLLLYTIHNVKAYQVENEKEQLFSPEGPQTLSLFMTSPATAPQGPVPDDNSQLILKFSSKLDFKLPTYTHISFQPPNSYLIPYIDNSSGIDSVVRIEFPEESSKNGISDEMDTFESILAQCYIMIDDNTTPLPQYDPSTYVPEETKKSGKQEPTGQIMIVDEENGEFIGRLGSEFHVVENAHLIPGSNGPVEITFPSENSSSIEVAPVSESYLQMAMHPVYKDSKIVSKAALASRFIVTSSSQVTKTLQSQADSFTKKTKPNSKPLKFEPTTHARIEKARKLTEDAVTISSLAAGQVQKYAQNFGASLTKRSNSKSKSGVGPDGKPIANFKPGLINKSLVAISTIADGIDQAGRSLLSGTSTAVTTVVSHKYGPEAGEISKNIGGGVRNCGLVYIDATGVTRRAIIKSVVKGATIGRLSDGTELVVGNSGVPGNDKGYYGKIDTPITEPNNPAPQANTQLWEKKDSSQDKVNVSHNIPPPPSLGSSDQEPLPPYRPSSSASK